MLKKILLFALLVINIVEAQQTSLPNKGKIIGKVFDATTNQPDEILFPKILLPMLEQSLTGSKPLPAKAINSV